MTPHVILVISGSDRTLVSFLLHLFDRVYPIFPLRYKDSCLKMTFRFPSPMLQAIQDSFGVWKVCISTLYVGKRCKKEVKRE